MSGKAKILDPKALEHLYVQSVNFRNKAQDATNQITERLNKLTDPAFLDGMKGGQGDAAVEAILAGKKALEELMASLHTTANFIDSKLEGAARLAKDKHGFGDKQAANKQAASNMQIKR